MTHKIVSVVVGLVLLLFVGAALAFAWSVSARAPEMAGRQAAPAIAHPVDQATASCGQCHAVTAGTLPTTLVPHAAATLEDKCVLCHGDPSLPLGMPASHVSYRVKRCAFCHAADPKRNLQPEAAGMSAQKAPRIKHPVTGAFATCTYCHRAGGQPSLPASHEAFGENTCRFVCHFRSAGK